MLFTLDIGSKKVGIISIFYETDKPSVDILPVHSSGSGFFVEITRNRGGDVDGIGYRPYISGANPKLLFCNLASNSTCSIGEIFREDSIQ